MGLHTYPDANVILNVFSEDKVRAQRASDILDDPLRNFVVSDYTWLETVPKAVYNKQARQVGYIEELFREARFVPSSAAIIAQAKELATASPLWTRSTSPAPELVTLTNCLPSKNQRNPSSASRPKSGE
jgi:hypothetical protein